LYKIITIPSSVFGVHSTLTKIKGNLILLTLLFYFIFIQLLYSFYYILNT